jgi:RNA recognition motif-containing protein
VRELLVGDLGLPDGDTAWFRLFVGDLSNDVSDDVLSNAFSQYTSFQKARVIRDRLSNKVRSVPHDVRPPV